MPANSLWKNRQYLIALLTASTYFGGLSFLLLFPAYLESVGATGTEIGWTIGLPLISFLIATPIAGWLSDRVSIKLPATLGIIIVGVSTLTLWWESMPGFWLYATRVLMGFGHGLAFSGVFAMAAKSLTMEQKATGIAWLTVCIQSGNVIGSYAAAVLTDKGFGLQSLVASAGIVFVAGAISLAARNATREEQQSQNANRAPMQWSPGIIGTLLFVLALGAAFGMPLQFVPAFLQHLDSAGLTAERIPSYAFVSVALAVVVGGRALLAPHVYQPGRERVLGVCMLALPLSIVLIPTMRNTWEVVGYAAAFGLTYGLLYPAVNASAFMKVGSNHQGKIAGLTAMMFEIGFRGFGFVLGPVITHFGYPMLFWMIAGFLVLCTGAFLALSDDRYRWIYGVRRPTAAACRA